MKLDDVLGESYLRMLCLDILALRARLTAGAEERKLL